MYNEYAPDSNVTSNSVYLENNLQENHVFHLLHNLWDSVNPPPPQLLQRACQEL